MSMETDVIKKAKTGRLLSITVFIFNTVYFGLSQVVPSIFPTNTDIKLINILIAILALYHAFLTFVIKDQIEVLNNNQSKNIAKGNSNIAKHIDDKIELLSEKVVYLHKEYVSVSELEIFESEFCNGSYSEAIIYIISNNLTKDRSNFYDEIKSNISQGVKYKYVVNSEYKERAINLKSSVIKDSEIKNIDENFLIYVSDDLFTACPKKFTVSIYLKEHGVFPCDIAGYCCAQDSSDGELYFFKMSSDNTNNMVSRVNNYINKLNSININN